MLNRHRSSPSQSGHLIGRSAGEPVHEKGAEPMCYLAVGCRVSAWCVWATLDPDAADVSRPRSLLLLPLVFRCRVGVYRAKETRSLYIILFQFRLIFTLKGHLQAYHI